MRRSVLVLVALFGAACAPARSAVSTAPAPAPSPSMWPTPVPTPLAIVHAQLWTAASPRRIADGTIVFSGGRIAAIGGPETAVPPGAAVIDAKGRVVTPGIIDSHSHVGVYPAPSIDADQDGNEMTDPVTAQVDASNSIWPQDPQILRALAGGTTTALILPGSGNLIGGRGVTIHEIPARTVRELKLDGAPPVLKMACGENPKRVYGIEKKTFPMTRMGNYAGYRAAFQQAAEYKKKWDAWRAKPAGDPPAKDFKMETLSGVLDGSILVENHCYKAEEMQEMMELGDEFGFKIRAFHHGLEAYKIRDLLAKKGVGVATWADWWGFKLEAWDGIPQNAALLAEAGVKVAIHSDDALGSQRLNQEAGKALAYGRRAGISLGEDDALQWITANPAWIMGVDAQTGTLEKGKLADAVIWSGDPFSVYSLADQVIVGGALRWDRLDPSRQPQTDFELGETR